MENRYKEQESIRFVPMEDSASTRYHTMSREYLLSMNLYSLTRFASSLDTLGATVAEALTDPTASTL